MITINRKNRREGARVEGKGTTKRQLGSSKGQGAEMVEEATRRKRKNGLANNLPGNNKAKNDNQLTKASG